MVIGKRKCGGRSWIACAVAAALMTMLWTPQGAQAGAADGCERADFVAAVAAANAQLSQVNKRAARQFKRTLRELRAANGWSRADTRAYGRSFIENPQVAALDARRKRIMAGVRALGAPGGRTAALAMMGATQVTMNAQGRSRACARLVELNQRMAALEKVIKARWAAMTIRAEAALTLTRLQQASAAQ
ncbi:MAG: hypothetical protein AAGF32_07335 [Pseudomonadota bacterium]